MLYDLCMLSLVLNDKACSSANGLGVSLTKENNVSMTAFVIQKIIFRDANAFRCICLLMMMTVVRNYFSIFGCIGFS